MSFVKYAKDIVIIQLVGVNQGRILQTLNRIYCGGQYFLTLRPGY